MHKFGCSLCDPKTGTWREPREYESYETGLLAILNHHYAVHPESPAAEEYRCYLRERASAKMARTYAELDHQEEATFTLTGGWSAPAETAYDLLNVSNTHLPWPPEEDVFLKFGDTDTTNTEENTMHVPTAFPRRSTPEVERLDALIEKAHERAQKRSRQHDEAVFAIRDLQAQRRAARYPAEPEVADLITFSRELSNRYEGGDATTVYHYAARKIGGRWYTTGSTCPARGYTWANLVEQIRNSVSWSEIELFHSGAALDAIVVPD